MPCIVGLLKPVLLALIHFKWPNNCQKCWIQKEIKDFQPSVILVIDYENFFWIENLPTFFSESEVGFENKSCRMDMWTPLFNIGL